MDACGRIAIGPLKILTDQAGEHLYISLVLMEDQMRLSHAKYDTSNGLPGLIVVLRSLPRSGTLRPLWIIRRMKTWILQSSLALLCRNEHAGTDVHLPFAH